MNIFEYLGLSRDVLKNIDISRSYLTYFIKKSDGKRIRRIDAPLPDLKAIQKIILKKLLYKYRAHTIAHGFVTGRSPKTNAEKHVGQKYIIKVDIKNFFPSILIDRVIYYLTHLTSNRRQKMFDIPSKEDIEILANILCLHGSLPQGAPTSPAFTNLVCYGLDLGLEELQTTYTCIITRYADDITVSCSNYDIVGPLVYHLNRILYIHGFISNKRKSRVCINSRRQKVTGIIVNNKLNTPKESWRNLRAAIQQACLRGNNSEEELQKLRGKIEWLRTLNPQKGNLYLKKLGQISVQKLLVPSLNSNSLF
jgi:RNA-directed DNA polymerase